MAWYQSHAYANVERGANGIRRLSVRHQAHRAACFLCKTVYKSKVSTSHTPHYKWCRLFLIQTRLRLYFIMANLNHMYLPSSCFNPACFLRTQRRKYFAVFNRGSNFKKIFYFLKITDEFLKLICFFKSWANFKNEFVFSKFRMNFTKNHFDF